MSLIRFGSALSKSVAIFMSYLLLCPLAPRGAAQQPQVRIPIPDVSPSVDAENEIGRLASARVVVRDQDERPINGAAVTFELPEGGFFASDGSRKAEVKTGPDGEAATPGFCPISAGPFDIQVTAGLGEEQNVATISQTNVLRFSRLALKILRGSGVTNYANLQRAGSQLPSDPAVQVTDENNRPIACADVSFQAPPPSAPGGAFSGVQRTVTARTGADGLATGARFRPNGQAGDFTISVSAGLAGLEAGARIAQTNKATSYAISVVKGSGAVNELGRLANTSAIRVSDEFFRRPIPRAGVTFELSENGFFLDGSQRAQAETDANGEASAPAFCPLRAGPVNVAATATTAGERLNVTVGQRNREPQFANLVIKPIQGQNAINLPKLQKATEPIVRLTNEAGDPVACAEVTFQLPKAGASGLFAGGELTYRMRTGPDGQATGFGLVPNAQPGKFDITVTAALPPLTAAVAIPQQNKGGAHKGLIVALLVVAAAGGVAAAVAGSKGSSPTSPPGVTTTPVVLSAGAGSVSHP